MKSNKILVTGATGNVGREVVKCLASMGAPVVAAVSNEDAAARVPQGVEGRVFRFGDESTYAAAFEGVDRLFLMRPPQIADVRRHLFPVIDVARDAGVRHIAFLSLLGVEKNKIVPHYKVEQHLLTAGVPYTFLRPSFYMQNLSTTHREEILENDVISVPVGRARTSFVDVRDIGEVAARVLTTEGHAGRAYDLTGPEALEYGEVAQIFTEVLGRRIVYTNPSPVRFYLETRRRGVHRKFALVMVALYTATRFGSGENVSDDVQRLLGRPPVSMRRFVEDYADTWSRRGE
ncbi:MAG: SDR family oxidoreductase [bacterium]